MRRGCVCGSRVKCTHLFNIRKAAAKVIRIFNSCRGLCGRKGSDNVWMPALGGTVSIVSLKMSAPQTIFQNHYPSHVANLLPMVILSLHPLRFYMLPPHGVVIPLNEKFYKTLVSILTKNNANAWVFKRFLYLTVENT